jgi:PucR C-terminal helix-turn-helix domain/GGDEF-like domain
LSLTATLPPEITGRLLSDVDAIARRMTRHIAEGVALRDERYRRPGYLRTVTVACRDAFRTLVRLLHDGRGLRAGDLDRLGSMGAHQAELGVPLEVVFSAYRVAAKVVWQEVLGEAALRNEVTPATLVSVTGQVLQYFDEISAAVGSAYLATRERLLRQADRDRDRILQRLLAGDTSDDLRRLAAATDLTLSPPYRVVACQVNGEGERQLESAWRAGGAMLMSDQPGEWIALLPAGAELGKLCDAVDGARFGLGPTAATLEEIAPAARRARTALDVGRRLDPTRRINDEAEVGIFAALASDRDALQRFIERTLGPLVDGRRPRSRDLLATVEALLDNRSIGEAADALGVHRHTVVYRISRLKDLGIDVDDPARRYGTWLALRAMRLIDTA